jgi:hypothetical protein
MWSEVFFPVGLSRYSRVEACDDLLEIETRLRYALERADVSTSRSRFPIPDHLNLVIIRLVRVTYLMTVEGHPT